MMPCAEINTDTSDVPPYCNVHVHLSVALFPQLQPENFCEIMVIMHFIGILSV